MGQTCPHCNNEFEQLHNTEYQHGPVDGDEIEVTVNGTCPHCHKPINIHSSAEPSKGDVPTEDELLNEAADKTLEIIRTTGKESIRSAATAAIQSLKHHHNWFHRDVDTKETIERVLKRIAEKTPDEWHGTLDYDCEDYPYRITNVTPCPHCGQEGIFNITVEESSQMVCIEDGIFVPDDFTGQKIVSVVCNSCFNEVHSEK
jgi:hypothetical protein